MKKTIVLFVLLFGPILVSGAQEIIDHNFFNLERIISEAQCSESQKEIIKSLLLDRQNEISKSSDSEFTLQVNRIYSEKIYEVLAVPQTKALIESFIDTKVIQAKAERYYTNYMSSRPFPSIYIEKLKEGLNDFEYNIAIEKVRYAFNEALKKEKEAAQITEKTTWVSKHNHAFRKAIWFTDYESTKCEPYSEALRSLFFNYHFYIELEKQGVKSSLITERIKELSNDSNMAELITTIANCDSGKMVEQFSRLPKVAALLKEEITTTVKNGLKKRLSLYKGLTKRQGIRSKVDLKKRLEAQKEVLEKEKKQEAIKALVLKAEAAGLDKERLSKFLAYVKQKEKDVEIYKLNKKNESTDIMEVSSQKTIQEIKKEFAKNVASVISKDEFAQILGSNLQALSKKKADKEISDILKTYEFTKDQQSKISERIQLYHFNETVYRKYYFYDRQLLKQKLSGLRYHFEKDYKSIMESFDIKIKSSKKANNNTFQY